MHAVRDAAAAACSSYTANHVLLMCAADHTPAVVGVSAIVVGFGSASASASASATASASASASIAWIDDAGEKCVPKGALKGR